jgi:hypothetical protein
MVKGALLAVVCGGCVVGAGPVIGYGKQRGFYAGVAGYGGVTMGQLSLEVGGTREGALVQGRIDVEASKLRTKNWPFGKTEEDAPYPGLRAGIGYARTGGAGMLATTVGPDVGVRTARTYCEGAPSYIVGIDWRYIGGEHQLVIAPRYETYQDICLR